MTTTLELRGEAILWMRDTWPTAVIIPELSVASWGGARLDVAAVTMDELIGCEIKGHSDGPGRLALQGLQYSAVCTRMFLLTCNSVRDRCLKQRPPGWIMARSDDGAWWKPGERGGGFDDFKTLPTSPLRLLELLWAHEVRSMCRLADVPDGLRGHARLTWISENVSLSIIRKRVLRALHLRCWEAGRMPKRVWRPDASRA